MCGITVIVKNSNYSLSPKKVLEINDSVSHRGPDAFGSKFFVKKGSGNYEIFNQDGSNWNIAFCHRRLSIIDLSKAGNQPMSYDTGNYWITYNGEIYNYVEIRNILIKKGYKFQSTSDTEVILASYVEWGPDCFKMFNGMWSIVIFDSKVNQIVVSRDRLGIKPLYIWSQSNKLLLLCSEIKQIMKLDNFRPRLNKNIAKAYIDSGYEKNNSSFYDDINQIDPGTWLVIDSKNLNIIKKQSFWDPSTVKTQKMSKSESGLQFQKEFFKSVEVSMRSDVPIGCQLSGGLDSSSILFAMDHFNSKASRINTFSSIYPNYKYNESHYIDAVLEKIDTEKIFSKPNSTDFTRDFDNFVHANDEPVGSFAQYSNYCLAREINKKNIKVVFNGQGADEIFGGYWQLYYGYIYGRIKLFDLRPIFSHFISSLFKGGNNELLKQLFFILRKLKNKNKANRLTYIGNTDLDFQNQSKMDKYFQMNPNEKRIFNIREFILPRLLKWDDRNLMAFSVEGRYPFLDHNLIELCLSFPEENMYNKGWTKYPLRLGMNQYLPRKIIKRKTKWAFEVPKEKWLRNDMRDDLIKWLNQDNAIYDFIDRKDIYRIFNDFLNYKNDDVHLVFRLYNFDKWMAINNIAID
tara:strand:+ start:9754 stop:11646 length:1893 start_codon:yes stop_codon:yes gene_type:complete